MSDAQLRSGLAHHFRGIGEDEMILQECISICRNYSLSAEELFFRWEALKYVPGRDTSTSVAILTPKDIVALKEAILHAFQQEQAKKAKKSKEPKARNGLNSLFSRPKSDGGLRLSKPAANLPAAQSGQLPSVRPSFRVSFKGPSEEPAAKKFRKYRYMFEKIVERSEVLDERIDEFREIARDHYGIEEFGDPSSATEEDIIAVGRVCGDADPASAPSSRLTEGSIYLETSRMMGSGARVPLKFDPLLKLRGVLQGSSSLGIFPGAIAIVKGRNGGGGWFEVKELYALPVLPHESEHASTSNVAPTNRAGFTMCITCGPYSPDSDLGYSPLITLLEKIKADRPEVLFMIGPFIDASHSKIKAGDIDYSANDIFERYFVENLRALLLANPDTLILLMPSVKDILSDHPVIPQCELEKELFSDPRVKFLPNPCRFSINGCSFAATSVDVLFHLRNQEYTLRGDEVESRPNTLQIAGSDVLANTCRLILQQRSFYPLFPVPQDMSHEVNLDVSHSDGLRLDTLEETCAPDILITPSRLKHFSKTVESTLTINPSSVTKGTYALATIGSSGSGSKGAVACEILRVG